MANSESPVFHSPDNDLEMEEAAAKARRTFRYFWREMAWERRRIVPGLDLAAVKGTFSDPPKPGDPTSPGLEVEHMWLLDVDFDGRRLEGTLINSPNSLTSLQEGDRVTISGKQICDWMYVTDGDVYGGFTVDVLRSRMSKRERARHDQAWGFDFGTVGVVNLVPPDFLGEPTSKGKGFLSRWVSSSQEPQDHAKVAETEHPMSVNMRDGLDQTFTKNPTLVHDTDDRGYTFLHQLSLAGSWDGVDVCLKHGANPKQAAPNGMTPFALAKCLNWKRVMERLRQAGATS